ncbi:hypothetical protein OIE69_03560 [Actinacidiphila glaucinigra]|uniref:hypothetical protein n=1 Tax=Actinacidiphila glaucinigra TaxID=235986 RepID=UPI002DD89FAD|nr:hypothetical protein [Actinacidiphila glaucinigra]WSD58038.1 hypothetical protein OIE69_03560 [Actinacidiphila glaucinigra]
MPPTAVLTIVAGTAGTLRATGLAVSGYRERPPRASGRPVPTNPPAAKRGVL